MYSGDDQPKMYTYTTTKISQMPQVGLLVQAYAMSPEDQYLTVCFQFHTTRTA